MTHAVSSPNGISVLLVDDEPASLKALEAVLTNVVEYRLVTARSGQDALKRVLAQDFAVIVLDVLMPTMDGFETARLIRARERSRLTPVIFLTADNQAGAQVLEAYRLGAADYMYKPFAPYILRSKVGVFVELFRKATFLEHRTAELTQETADLARYGHEVGALNAELDEQLIEQSAALDVAIGELKAEATERARAEATLRTGEERNRLALQAAGMGVWDVDLSTGACTLSDVARRLTGLPVDAPITLAALRAVIRSDDRQAVQQALAHAVRTDSEFDAHIPVVWADDSVHWLESRGRLLKDGSRSATRIAGTVRDITLQKSAEQALQRSEARLQGLVQSAMDAIVSVDEQQRVVLFNAAAERVFGYSADQVLGEPLEMLLAESCRAAYGRFIAAFAETGVTSRSMGQQPLAARRSDGTEFPIEAAISQAVLEGGRLFTVILRDITDRLEAERQREGLARNEKLRAVGQMASGIAHDLNQTLMLITSYTDLASEALHQRPPNLAELDNLLTTATQAAMDGGETVKQLLLFARALPDRDGRVVDLRSVVADAAQLTAPRWRNGAQAEGRPIWLHIEAEGTPTIQGFPEQLRELMTNLIFNAVDALPAGGTIRLRVWAEHEQGIIEVIDSGMGMSAEIQERIFEPFFTTKGESGSGLGLAMVFGIVERHAGRIEVWSAPGTGTTFHLSFPLVAGSLEIEPSAAPAGPPDSVSSLRILIVDDEPMVTRAVSRMLKSSGQIVEVAASGEEALETLSRQPYDVVVSDLGMGAGMNGFELAEMVRDQWPAVRFLLATGWGATIDPGEARTRGVESVLAKPYRRADLLVALAGADATA